MVILITKNMKVYDKVSDQNTTKKVFMLRGDERYARSTDVKVTYTKLDISEFKGVRCDIKVNLYRTIGSSSVIVYDGEEILDMRTVGTNTTEFTLKNVYLSYGHEHNLYAVYKGNSECLSSKSQKVTFVEPLPASFVSQLVFDMPTVYSNVPSINMNLNAYVNDIILTENAEVEFYVDGEYYSTAILNNGRITNHPISLSNGLHTITANLIGSDTLRSASESITVSVGYKVSVVQLTSHINKETTAPSGYTSPNRNKSTVINDTSNIVKVQVLDYFDNNINNVEVSFNGHTSRTYDGIATFEVINIDSGTYDITVDNIIKSVDIDAVTITDTSLMSSTNVKGYPNPIHNTIGISSDDNSSLEGVKATVTTPDGTQNVTLTKEGTFTALCYPTGTGTNNITVDVGGLTKTLTYDDYLSEFGTSGTNNFHPSKIVGNMELTKDGYKIYTTDTAIIGFDFEYDKVESPIIRNYETSFDITRKSGTSLVLQALGFNDGDVVEGNKDYSKLVNINDNVVKGKIRMEDGDLTLTLISKDVKGVETSRGYTRNVGQNMAFAIYLRGQVNHISSSLKSDISITIDNVKTKFI